MKGFENRISRAELPAPRAGGFTLIELMIAIAVLAVIIGIAIPSYNQYVLEAGRAEAKGVLMQGAQTLERCFTRFSSYTDSNCDISQGSTMMSENDKYQLQATTVTANDFLLTAVPQGGQANDSECGNFTLDNTGARGISASTDPAVVDECW